ncbi:VanW family protein [Nannocystis pusilla]|uniref:VanW family protein n=1 Tax=Nannocystis pusilla TaxID=889268 RepID=A0ABS7U3U3_9BACT|nr:VanW family protein [Nannocystis pusilla]MBZ5715007.1 VanW family protein [Nannocystis pusilla]
MSTQPAPRAGTAARTLAPRRAQPRTLAPTAAPALELVATSEAAPETAAGVRRRRLTVLPVLESAAMAIGLAAVAAVLWQDLAAARDEGRVIPGVRLGGHDVGGMTAAELPAIAETAVLTALDRKLVLAAPGVEVESTARALGAVPAPETAIAAALRVGHSGDLLADLRARDRALRGEVDLAPGFRFNEDVALEQLLALAPRVERPSLATRFDMDNRRVLPAQRGSRLSAFDSLSAVAVGLASGADRIDLVTQPGPEIPDPWASIADGLDIGAVLAAFETPYSTEGSYADRAYNLKIGAAPLDGYVLMPGATMSFNQVVGDRTGEAGYRFAAGIADGELIDTVGGGICQISSTLYGAAFFAGLDLVHSRPHSRPSAYVDMGLDSTVVYGHVDMKLKNPFDFPVVFHTRVAAGKVRVEVLGARKVFDEVAFERRVQEVLPFNTIVRNDSNLASGAETVSQRGMRGFKVVRTRKLYQAGEVARTESWDLFYPPTTEIVRRGTNPRGERPDAKKLQPLRDPARELRIVQ